jgi:spore coat protein CotH
MHLMAAMSPCLEHLTSPPVANDSTFLIRVGRGQQTSIYMLRWLALGSLLVAQAFVAGCGTSAGGGAALGGSGDSQAGASTAGSTTSGGSGSGGAEAGSSAGMAVGGGGTSTIGGTTAGAVADAGSGGGADLSAEIYDPTKLPRFDIDLPQASVDQLNEVSGADDPKQDIYVTATLRYGAETVGNIGLRLKGEGSFQKLDRKPPFKIKFDEFVPKQEFRGLRRLALNNLWEDASFIAERLAYDVYRAAGLPAPRCNSALVYVNGTFYGVYANVEAEDKTFLKRWFPTDGGNLYEEGQTDFVPGAETAFDLETNETANDRTDLKNLIAAIQSSSPQTFLTDIGGQLDTAHFLKFTAVEAAVNQWDMYSYTVFYMNNFRLYHDPTSKKFTFIPWGHDLSMKPFRDSGKPFIGVFELARQGDAPSGSVSSGTLFQRCLQSPTCKAAYADAVREIAALYEGLKLEERAASYYEQVKEDVYRDTRKNICCNTAPITNEQFEAGYQSVLKTIRGRVAALREDLATE